MCIPLTSIVPFLRTPCPHNLAFIVWVGGNTQDYKLTNLMSILRLITVLAFTPFKPKYKELVEIWDPVMKEWFVAIAYCKEYKGWRFKTLGGQQIYAESWNIRKFPVNKYPKDMQSDYKPGEKITFIDINEKTHTDEHCNVTYIEQRNHDDHCVKLTDGTSLVVPYYYLCRY